MFSIPGSELDPRNASHALWHVCSDPPSIVSIGHFTTFATLEFESHDVVVCATGSFTRYNISVLRTDFPSCIYIQCLSPAVNVRPSESRASLPPDSLGLESPSVRFSTIVNRRCAEYGKFTMGSLFPFRAVSEPRPCPARTSGMNGSANSACTHTKTLDAYASFSRFPRPQALYIRSNYLASFRNGKPSKHLV